MALSYAMRSLIDELTKDIIHKYNIQIPINNIDEIVIRMGGRLRESSDLSEYSDGVVRKLDENSFEIMVSKYQGNERKNFTVAHEIGHLFLHMGYKIDPEKWRQNCRTYYRNGDSQEEYEANEFAAALLMPKEEYRRVMYKYVKENWVDTSKIAQEFHVSVNAASNRGKWLGLLEW